MKIVQAEIDGAIYWVASETGTREDVLRLINDDASVEESLTDCHIGRFEVLDAAQAAQKMVVDDDDRVSLATFARSMTKPGVIVCSEWD